MAEASPRRGKMRFRRNAVSFPGNLHLILVLRPTGFLQRTFTGIGFRFNQDDFMMKLPVVVLSSVSDLLKYIDGKQLTPELGGTLQYSHREWIIFRNAIENFAVTVKEMAQMLQSFGTELAETELPDDIPGVEELLAIRAERYHVLKNDITAVTNEGTILLTNLEGPGPQEAVRSRRLERRHQISSEWQTIQKLLTQVHDMESAFDGFWEKHKQKMEQYLQLWKFEQDFQKLMNEIELILNQQAELGDVSGNIAQIRQKLRMLDSLEENSQNLLTKTRFVILHGHRLASNHHYALDLICQRCNELRYLTDIVGNEIKAKQLRLSRVFKMHKLLQQARQCCDEGEGLIVNHEIDKLQSKEDAEKALQDIENFLDMSLPFINYDIERLQYEFDTILSPELKIQMQTIQLKLANIRSAFESQQAGFRNLEDTCMGPLQFVVPGTDHLIKSTGPFFAPKHVGIGYSFFQACKLFSKGKPWRENQSNLKMEVVQDRQEKSAPSQPPTSEHDNSLEILKNHVLNELIQSERVYVRELFAALLGYRAEMDNPEMYDLMPPLLRNNKDVLFGNMAEIYKFHNDIFMSSLDNCQNAPEQVGRCFLERKKEFQMYAKYCLNKPRSEKIWKKCSECAFFQECQKKLKHRLGLDSYLLKPVQRITKYQLLLKDLLKYSTDCEGTEQLKAALDSILELLKSVNDSMHQIAVTGYVGNLNDLGKMIMQGPFSVWMGHRKGPTKMKDFARFKPMQRVLFLYEKAIIFCKKRMEGGEGSERFPSYSFKNCLDINEVGVTEYVKGDGRKFELWSSGKEEVYTLQAPNMDVKMTWLKEIRTILLKQQELAVKKQEQRDQMAGQGPLSLKQNDKQKGSSVSTEVTASAHIGAAAMAGNAEGVPVHAEASRAFPPTPTFKQLKNKQSK
ncbi:proto-oncogene DBL [Echinops telfairi]|uniref:Proto-oncogene DBL n=1 Tax=Echinops telfairi TaxID=9371 RepID=A0AC55CXS5_ECHTE|nr:proto-oncogene DBL [Echinops telfairi]